MDQSFDIQTYMTRGVERVVGDIVRTTLRNPRESAYMARFEPTADMAAVEACVKSLL